MLARVVVNAMIGFAWAVDRLARRDRKRHIAQCSAYSGKLVCEPAYGPQRRPSFYRCERALECGCEAAEVERLRNGAALAEALFCQLREIRLLPCVEPKRTLAP